jgi:hypothetical protein
MCAFCAAIPVAGAVGAKVQAKQRQEAEQARAEGRPVKKARPIGRITAVVIIGLAAGSFVYHTHMGMLF